MTHPRRRLPAGASWLFATVLLGGCGIPAQEPEPEATQEVLEIRIVCKEVGEPVPRNPGAEGEEPGPYRLEGHRVHWFVGDELCRNQKGLVEALDRRIEAADDWGPGPHDRDRWNPPPVRLVIGSEVRYGDVSTTVDVLFAKGLMDLRFFDGRRLLYLPVAVSEPPRDPWILPPAAKYQEPLETGAESRWTRFVDVLQDSRVRVGEEVIHDPEVDEQDAEALRKLFLGWRNEAREQGLLGEEKSEDGSALEFVRGRVVIRADRWTKWSAIQQVMRVASERECGFWFFRPLVLEGEG